MGFETQSQLPFGLWPRNCYFYLIGAFDTRKQSSRVSCHFQSCERERGSGHFTSSLLWPRSPPTNFKAHRRWRVKGIPKPVWKAKAQLIKFSRLQTLFFYLEIFPSTIILYQPFTLDNIYQIGTHSLYPEFDVTDVNSFSKLWKPFRVGNKFPCHLTTYLQRGWFGNKSANSMKRELALTYTSVGWRPKGTGKGRVSWHWYYTLDNTLGFESWFFPFY